MAKNTRSTPTPDGVPYFERLHALPCDILGVIPHDELYICCPDKDWPWRCAETIVNRPDLFSKERRQYYESLYSFG